MTYVTFVPSHKRLVSGLLVLIACASAQVPPDASRPDLNPTWLEQSCPAEPQVTTASESERELQAAYAEYRAVLPLYFAKVSETAEAELFVPVNGVRVADIADTYGAPRSGGRIHAGLDIFAERGTTVRSATPGFVWSIATVNPRAGNAVTVVGAGGRRYYYSHLDSVAPELQEGQYVTPETALGFVGNTGNATSTPPHLHFEIADGFNCDWNVINPAPLLQNR